ncbi:MAG TPA: O-antigen ligase family protein [Flavobacteriales bacterium]|nr:O-antigen ligase family protein [Flavobacteriales bacterium]
MRIRRALPTVIDRVRGSWPMLMVLIFGLAPISVKIFFAGIGTEVVVPVEPLIGIAAIIVVITLFQGVARYQDLLPRDPISWCVFCTWMWMVLCVPMSSMPMVSAKASVVRTCYLLVFYVGVRRMLEQGYGHLHRAMWAYVAGFGLVMIHVFLRVGGTLTRSATSFAPFPFYNDHTIYAAAAVFVLLFLLTVRIPRSRALMRMGWMLVVGLVLIALITSFSRAGWLSMAGALVVWSLWSMPRVVTYVGGALGVLLITAFLIQDDRWRSALHGTVDSYSPGAGFGVSLRSMTDVSMDSSNRERLNRWRSALRMADARPVAGFGPGTFQFRYLEYQRPEDRTYLTVDSLIPKHLVTRAWSATPHIYVRANPQVLFSSGGTAHSEYLLVLAESGWPGLMLQLATLGFVVFAGWRARGSALVRYALLAVLAYAAHGMVNNFLDDPKIAALYFSAFAILSMTADPGIRFKALDVARPKPVPTHDHSGTTPPGPSGRGGAHPR